jgi:hypothetical protein
VVVNNDRFGFCGVDGRGDQSVPDLPTGLGCGAAVVGSAVAVVGFVTESVPFSSASTSASASSSADFAPALPAFVDVIAPPELSTCIPPVESPDSPASSAPSPVSDVVSPDEPAEPVEGEPEVPPDVDADESVDDVDPASGSAHATPGVLATAAPTPNATANAPTRPTYLA